MNLEDGIRMFPVLPLPLLLFASAYSHDSCELMCCELCCVAFVHSNLTLYNFVFC